MGPQSDLLVTPELDFNTYSAHDLSEKRVYLLFILD